MRRCSSVAALLILCLAVLAPGVALAAAGWTYGAEYLARTETYETGNSIYQRQIYWRPAYRDGIFQFAEFVRNVDYFQGHILTYGLPEIATQASEYSNPPHLSHVTRYQRPVFRYGVWQGFEMLPDLTVATDICQVSEGEGYAVAAVTVENGGRTTLQVTYRHPVYHSNPKYGRFLTGYIERVQSTTVSPSPSPPGAAGSAPAPAQTPIDVALRQIGSVEEFADYTAISSNRYGNDIGQAFELGLIAGKYDETTRFYDPDAAVTVGEMVNILARNLGAGISTQGTAALDYLARFGVSTTQALDSALTVATLESLASQVSSLPIDGRADLLVLRQALSGELAATQIDSITRAHAVAMYRPVADRPVIGTTNQVAGGSPAPTVTVTATAANLPSSGTTLPGTANTAGHAADLPDNQEYPSAPIEPVFFLTD